jgi:hypothetical protein
MKLCSRAVFHWPFPFTMGFFLSIWNDNSVTAGSRSHEKSSACETDRGSSNKTRERIGELVESVTRKISLHSASLERRFTGFGVERSVRCRESKNVISENRKKREHVNVRGGIIVFP